MNYLIFTIEAFALVVAFSLIIMIPLCKNPVWWIHDYPKDIQDVYFETHERIPTEPFSKTVLRKKSLAILFALVLMVALVWLCGARTFSAGFLTSYALWLIIDWYDCFFLDWVLFANLKRIRLPGTENMDKAYHQKKFHVVRSFVGMVIGLIPCLLTGVIVMVIR